MVTAEQDIDALMVGALYGELGPADEARLAAHLESHPTDKSALEGLRSTRQAFLDCKFFELRAEPPAQVSALLVQEAARRAPRKAAADDGESWLARIVRRLAAHPAAAAAAMLVVVVAAAGTIYMKKGADMAQPSTTAMSAPREVDEGVGAAGSSISATYASAPVAPPTAQPEVAASPPPPPQQIAQADQPDLYKKGGESSGGGGVVAAGPAGAAAATETGNGEGIPVRILDSVDRNADNGRRDLALAEPGHGTAALGAKPAVSTKTRAIEGIVVAGNEHAPKDLERERGGDGVADVPASPAAATIPAPSYDAKNADYGAATATTTAPTPTPTQQQAPSSWARDQHAKIGSLVRAGRCQDAAAAAVEIRTRAPDYYSAYVASDRSLKQCMPYIAGAVERSKEAAAPPAKADRAPAAAKAATDSAK